MGFNVEDRIGLRSGTGGQSAWSGGQGQEVRRLGGWSGSVVRGQEDGRVVRVRGSGGWGGGQGSWDQGSGGRRGGQVIRRMAGSSGSGDQEVGGVKVHRG